MSPVAEIWVLELGPNRNVVIQAIDQLLHYGYTSIYKRLKAGPLLIAVDDSARAFGIARDFRRLGATVGWRLAGDKEPLRTVWHGE